MSVSSDTRSARLERERYVQSYAGVRKRMGTGGTSGDECDTNTVSRGTWETERTSSPAGSVKEGECSDPAGTEKLSGTWYLLLVYHCSIWGRVLYWFWFYLIFSCNYKPKLTALLLSNVKWDHKAEKHCQGRLRKLWIDKVEITKDRQGC